MTYICFYDWFVKTVLKYYSYQRTTSLVRTWIRTWSFLKLHFEKKNIRHGGNIQNQSSWIVPLTIRKRSYNVVQGCEVVWCGNLVPIDWRGHLTTEVIVPSFVLFCCEHWVQCRLTLRVFLQNCQFIRRQGTDRQFYYFSFSIVIENLYWISLAGDTSYLARSRCIRRFAYPVLIVSEILSRLAQTCPNLVGT